MRRSDRALAHRLFPASEIEPEEAAVEETVRRARLAFREHEAARSLSWAEFLYRQSRFIDRRWWLFQALLLLALWLLLAAAQTEPAVRRCIGAGAPLFAVLAAPELLKNRLNRSVEIECAALFSLRQIYAARLLCFALADLLLLSVFFPAAALSVRLRTLELLTQFLVPFNVACCLLFRALCSRREGSELRGILLCLIYTLAWGLAAGDRRLYAHLSGPAWLAMLGLSLAWLATCAGRSLRVCEKDLEVSLWN